MARPPSRRISCDAYTVVVDGVAYQPHLGESVWVAPTMTVQEMTALAAMSKHQPEIDAMRGEPDEAQRAGRLFARLVEEACDAFAPLVLDWDLTDRRGQPLPRPDGTTEAMGRVDVALLMWLVQHIGGESEDARKNDGRPSPITSSATATSSRARSSQAGFSGGRNRAKRS